MSTADALVVLAPEAVRALLQGGRPEVQAIVDTAMDSGLETAEVASWCGLGAGQNGRLVALRPGALVRLPRTALGRLGLAYAILRELRP